MSHTYPRINYLIVMISFVQVHGITCEIFDIKRPTIHYNVSFYKFRTGSRSLMLGSGSIGGSITLNREALN